MIREAYLHEVRNVITFMKQFEQASRHVKVDIDHSVKQYEGFIKSGVGVMLVLFDDEGKINGGLGALGVPDLHSGEITAIETFWYVAPEFRGHGIKLLYAFEKWAEKNGCTKAAMIHMEDSYPSTLKKLYERRGYRLIESHYVKEII